MTIEMASSKVNCGPPLIPTNGWPSSVKATVIAGPRSPDPTSGPRITSRTSEDGKTEQ